MKKVLLTAILAVAGFTAQAQKDGAFGFGAKIGPNFSTLTGDNVDVSPTVGVHVGVFAELKVADSFGIQPELLFSMQGATNDYYYYDGFETESVDWTRLSYVNLPIMGKYYTPLKGLNVLAGPQVGFLISAKEKGYVSDGEGNSRTDTYDVKDSYKSLDIAICAGVEYEFNFGLIASFRGNFGLMNIADYPGGTLRNNVLQLSAGYKFL